MGSNTRPKPERLAEKLIQIRNALGLSQNEMIRALGCQGELLRETLSSYEIGRREPPLPLLLKYARIAGVIMDLLVDDKLDLPKKLPCHPKHPGIPRKDIQARPKNKMRS